MTDFNSIIKNGFAHYIENFRWQTVRLATGIPESSFWIRPYPYGNSIGNLVLHLNGNFGYYIGTVIGRSGYLRNREQEFFREHTRSRDSVLQEFNQTVDTVLETLEKQSTEDWPKEYSAVGVDDVHDRFSIFLRCTVHFHHHIGQMIYISKAINGETNL